MFAASTPPQRSSRDGFSLATSISGRRGRVAALLCVLLVACGAPKQQATRHNSFVPSDLHPADAKRLIVIGDSIGAGSGASTRSLSFAWLLQSNDDAAWPAERGASLTARYGHPVDLCNLSVPGATTSTVRQQEAALGRILPGPVTGHSIVTITIGGNDLYGRIVSLGEPTPGLLDAAVRNLRELVGFLNDRARFPDGTSIYVLTVFDPTDGAGQAPQCFFGLDLRSFIPALDAWRGGYVRLGAELHFAVVDALGAFHGHGFRHGDTVGSYFYAPDPSLWFSPDGYHPNDRGHNEIRRLFFEAIDGRYVATP